jgi:hypothetical protein
MEITGCDQVIFTFESPHVVCTRVISAILLRWPNVIVKNFDENGIEILYQIGKLRGAAFPAAIHEMLLLRDEDMKRHMTDHAYVPMADGDGPFAILSRVRRHVEFEFQGLIEKRVDDRPTSAAVSSILPYQAWLCTPRVFEITAVLSGDPQTHPFSTWLLEEVKQACRGIGS